MQIVSVTGEVLLEVADNRLQDADLRHARLEGADLRRAHLEGARLERADLRRAHLEGAHLEGADLEEANLHSATLEGAHLKGTDLRRAHLHSATLQGAHLEGARLEGANLEWADLRHASLEVAHLEGANLGGANLDGARLNGARLDGARLEGARLEGARLFPHPLAILNAQGGPVRVYKLTTKNGNSPFFRNRVLNYDTDEAVTAACDPDKRRDCADGIHVATLDWCLRHWEQGWRILILECEAQTLVIPHASDGKFRTSAVRRVGEVPQDWILALMNTPARRET